MPYNEIIAIALVLASAAVQALSNVLQHKAASRRTHGGSAAMDLLRSMRSVVFALGISLMLIGGGLHIAALGFGSIIIVQTVFVSQLIFVLPFSAWIAKLHIMRRDWIAAVAVTAGIATFVIVANPTGSNNTATTAESLTVVLATTGLCLALGVIAYLQSSGVVRAVLLGIAGGIFAGLFAPLTKAVIGAAGAGIPALLGNWLTWAFVAIGILALALPFMAFQAGRITTSLPLIMVLNPVYATVLGIWLFDERVDDSPVALAVIAVSIVVMIVGVVFLSRSEVVAASFDETVEIAR